MSFWQHFVGEWSDDDLSGERIVDIVQTSRLPGVKSQGSEEDVMSSDDPPPMSHLMSVSGPW